MTIKQQPADILINSDVLPLLRADCGETPKQVVLVGRRVLLPQGLTLTIQKIAPFETLDSHLTSLLNGLVDGDEEETILGWAISTDRSCNLTRVARTYFELFIYHFLRVLVANLAGEEDFFNPELLSEMVDLFLPLVGLISLRDISSMTSNGIISTSEGNGDLLASPSYAMKELYAFRTEITDGVLMSLMEEPRVMEYLSSDSFSEWELRSIYQTFEDWSGIRKMAIDELIKESRLLSTPSIGLGDSKSQQTLSSALSSSKLKAKPRRERATRRGVPSSLSLSSKFSEAQATQNSVLKLIPATVEIFKVPSSELDEMKSSSYREASQEMELLCLIYKIISQSEDVLLKKLTVLEDYDEKMKKIGARLKNSMSSPEEVLRSLVRIKPAADATSKTTIDATGILSTAKNNHNNKMMHLVEGRNLPGPNINKITANSVTGMTLSSGGNLRNTTNLTTTDSDSNDNNNSSKKS